MSEKAKQKWVYVISFVFIALNSYFIAREMFWFMLLPVIGAVLLMYIFSLDKLLLLVVFATPLAITIQDPELSVRMSMPTEPLLFGILILFIIKLFFQGGFDRRVTLHLVSIAIIINLVWIALTSVTSELPIVSLKFLVARLWFVLPVYFLGTQLFRKYDNIHKFSWLYITALLIVIIYTIYHHSKFNFDEEPGHWVMSPFYNDHTSYGAVLAMFLPVIAGFIISRDQRMPFRLIAFGLLLVFIVALVLSYSRAAWISVVVSTGVFLLVMFRIRFRWVAITTLFLAFLLYFFQAEIFERLEKNKQDSSADFIEHVRSISNISSDASNLERINRWQSAIRMYHERPLWGWGPGTYQFLYAPYQHSQEKTIISTNAGDLGNAHSEYIGPLAETGLPGMLAVLLIVIVVIYKGLMVYREADTREVRILALTTVLGLISYYVHGLLNNFLDTDKASVPVWGFTAIIVALDLYHKKRTGNASPPVPES